uniref:Uncharacterized protein n=1 Tax=Cannabis sativa TaxID=3483 RepID=A0A803QGW0_CANSA
MTQTEWKDPKTESPREKTILGAGVLAEYGGDCEQESVNTGDNGSATATASSMLVYAMSTNKIPLSSCREMDAILRKYWWLGNVENDRFMALRAWDQICQPKSLGGLRIRIFENMNRALPAKLSWSLANREEKPWATCLLGKYYKHENFWRVEQKSNDSYQWKCILEVKEILAKGSVILAVGRDTVDF